jgi:hypothetical protein
MATARMPQPTADDPVWFRQGLFAPVTEEADLPAGDFDAHFTFAQTLSESAKLAGNTLLVVSIPASQNEIGGEGGQAALERLKNVLERVETSWRPASTEEGFEIVRRRLFQPITMRI